MPELKLDILRPATEQLLPLAVFLPGGAFIFSNRVNAYARRAFVAESGFVVASVEYRTTTSNASYIDSIQDIRAALGHLVAHADDYGIDPRGVAVWGESAGGYLAAMTADPVTYLHANATEPSFLLLHGTADVLIAPSQTQRLHQALLAAGADSTRYLLRGANHGDLAIGDPEGALPWSSTTTMGIITEFLHSHLDRR
ncbi:alpha/beta hydrolase [Paractinoplanes globisporus]|uniref:Alpha/beta hydrolase n=1 Tax=Paractinoplanes globisporus TaxID=113565 RepID=A0ABW6WCQ2_9ACTN|nr:alpha/beta hydrolase [Actinoplanes globisporus]